MAMEMLSKRWGGRAPNSTKSAEVASPAPDVLLLLPSLSSALDVVASLFFMLSPVVFDDLVPAISASMVDSDSVEDMGQQRSISAGPIGAGYHNSQ
mmetsp:Transcript_14115/g.30429  ORF Transcript_14115/g.30429 Transcript_14115/m.30429 type:complete len:96 (+) Transcript_14115:3517-3804(+)